MLQYTRKGFSNPAMFLRTAPPTRSVGSRDVLVGPSGQWVLLTGASGRFSAVFMRVRSRIRGDDDVVSASERVHNFSVRLEDEAEVCYRVECLDAGCLTARRDTTRAEHL